MSEPNNHEPYRLRRLESLVEKHDQDLYRGNGKPGITTRLQQSEDWRESQEEEMTELLQQIQDMRKERMTRENLILGGIVSLIVGLILAHFKVI